MFATLISLVIPAGKILHTFKEEIKYLISGIGLILRWLKPTIADRFTRWLRVITLFFIVYILTFGIYTNLYVFKLINFKTVLVSAALPYMGFLIGFLMSLITKQNRERSIAIFIESGKSKIDKKFLEITMIFKGLQNTGVAIFFLRLSLPQPDSDLAIVVPIFVSTINLKSSFI